MSTPGPSPSDGEMVGGHTPHQTPGSRAGHGAGATSSPLHFPSSSPARTVSATPKSVRNGNENRAIGNVAPSSARGYGESSPLRFPSSSIAGTPRAAAGRSSVVADDAGRTATPGNAARQPHQRSGLFLDDSPRSSLSTPRARRGEIHSTALQVSPAAMRQARNHAARHHTPVGTEDGAASSFSDFSLSQAMPSEGHGLASAGAPAPDQKVIWGTTVSIGATMTMFREFLRAFKLKYRWAAEAKEQGEGPATRHAHVPAGRKVSEGETLVYENYLRRMRITDQTNLNLRVSDLAAFGPSKQLAHHLVKYPNEVVPIMDQVLKDEMIDLAERDAANAPRYGGGAAEEEERQQQISADMERLESSLFKVRAFGLDAINMRQLNPSDIDKLITIRGLVIRCTPIIPDMKQAFFRCMACNHTIPVELDRGRITEPDRCPRDLCNQQGSISLIHNRCEFADRQVIRLQETPDAVPDGQTPHTVTLCAYDELVDVSKPGDRVEVTGIFRSQAVRVNPRARTQKSLYKTFVDVIHIKQGDTRRLGLDVSTRGVAEKGDARRAQALGVGGEEDDDADDGGEMHSAEVLTSETEEKLRAIGNRPDCYELLARSLAPSIYEMEDVKKGILLQLFGGTNKTISSGGGGGGPRYRGDINVLMVGDPGTSKSQLLMYVHKIAPRGVYASGKGSSAVGLTAYVTRDPDTKQLVLESGALVLSDGGVCCIDEFDKMSDATRSVLHEVMEQQTVSIAKAGIITTLNARTSVLAAANPVGSKYNVRLPITRNIDLPPTLISRFDLVYLVLDKVDEASDRRLARHLVGLYLEDRPSTAPGADVLPIETLTSYIGHVRANVHPVISAAAGNALAERYVALRKAGEDPRSSERRITATTRQLESMIRLSEAHARMRWSETVDVEDVDEAARLIAEATKSSATDPTTGLIDLDLVNTGRGLAGRKLASDLRREVISLVDAMGGGSNSAAAEGAANVSSRAVRYAELAKALAEQSTYGSVDPSELYNLIKTLETEGILKISGSGDRRTVKRVG